MLQRQAPKEQHLAHPNLTTGFDFDHVETTNVVFMTREVLDGVGLALHICRNIHSTGLPYADATVLIEQIGSGLATALRRGV